MLKYNAENLGKRYQPKKEREKEMDFSQSWLLIQWKIFEGVLFTLTVPSKLQWIPF